MKTIEEMMAAKEEEDIHYIDMGIPSSNVWAINKKNGFFTCDDSEILVIELFNGKMIFGNY